MIKQKQTFGSLEATGCFVHNVTYRTCEYDIHTGLTNSNCTLGLLPFTFVEEYIVGDCGGPLVVSSPVGSFSISARRLIKSTRPLTFLNGCGAAPLPLTKPA